MQEIYPEIIQGLWWCTKADESKGTTRDLFAFNADGTFVRVVYKQGVRRDAEQGQYTFDGNFLITRGRSTETYRVTIEDSTKWVLDGKRYQFVLSRRASTPLSVLDEATTRMLRLLPQRVRLEALDKMLPHSFRMWFSSNDDQESIELGIVHAFEQHPGVGWIGLTVDVECSPLEDTTRVWHAVASGAVRPVFEATWSQTWVRVVTQEDTDTLLT